MHYPNDVPSSDSAPCSQTFSTPSQIYISRPFSTPAITASQTAPREHETTLPSLLLPNILIHLPLVQVIAIDPPSDPQFIRHHLRELDVFKQIPQDIPITVQTLRQLTSWNCHCCNHPTKGFFQGKRTCTTCNTNAKDLLVKQDFEDQGTNWTVDTWKTKQYIERLKTMIHTRKLIPTSLVASTLVTRIPFDTHITFQML